MKLSILVLAFAVFGFMAPAVAQATDSTDTPIKVVSFHSDNCGSCKILAPKMKEALGQVDADQLHKIKFDLTSKETIANSKELAAKEGVEKVLNKFGAKTGFVVLVDQNGDIVNKITSKDDVDVIKTKLSNAIDNAV